MGLIGVYGVLMGSLWDLYGVNWGLWGSYGVFMGLIGVNGVLMGSLWGPYGVEWGL